MRIQTNIPAMYAYNRYRRTNTDMAKTLEKLSSGFRINRASDDASGLAISEKMRCSLTELERCRQNVSEGINIVKTADAALEEVNEMLIRARYLCAEAANGTYGEQELDAVGDEINSLFTEVDRITVGSNYNKIPLFRNAVPDSHIERREMFDPLPAGQIKTWGGIDFIHGLQKFVAGDKAKGAEATFTLEDGIDFSDKMSLDGKAVTIESGGKKYVYLFDGGTYGNLNYSGNGAFRIDLKSAAINSVEDALKQLAKASPLGYSTTSSDNIISEVKVDQDTREVTLVSRLADYVTTLSVDGRTERRTVKDGDGTKYQSATVSGPNGKLSFDKIELGNPTYANTAKATFDFSFLASTIDKETCDNLKQNQLVVGDKTIALSDIITGNTITSRDFVQKLSDKINNLDGYTASYNTTSTARTITITASGLSTTSPANILVYEKVTPSGGTSGSYQTALTGKSPGITVTKKQEATGERGAVFEIKVPTANMPQSGSSDAISFQIVRPNGVSNQYFLYDTTVNTDEELRKNCPGATGSVYKSVTPTDIHGKSQADVRDFIIGKIKEVYKEADGYRYTINGDTITLESPLGETNEPRISTYSATVQFYKPGETTSTGSKHVLYNQSDTTKGVGASASSYDTKYLKQNAVYTISGLSNTAASIQTLAGKSFQLTNPDGPYLGSGTTRGVVFYNSNNGAITAPAGYDLVDLKGIATVAKLKDELNKTGIKTDAGFTAAVSGTNITLTLSKNTDGRNVSKSSGYHEVTSIVDGTEKVKFEGGTVAGHDHYSIDFSSITDDNLESLLGKGFRVNCATCSGEYINVVFCWENSGNRMPESFQVFDKASNQMRTIHNVAVELSKVKSASSIVQDIVDQVESQLKHYTALSVDEENPAILIAQDRRVGDVYNGPATPANRVYGSVEGGLKTNFTYSIADVKVRDFPPDGSVYLKDGGVDIYVGSDPDPSLIHLHLPYIDLETLRLGKPGEVNLKASDQNASDWLERIDTANNAISKARGILGADQNRLEHTANALACEDENLAAAESRIRDADIAELMMNYTKLQIQIQAQQSMLAQANQRPQSVLQLLD